MTITLNATDSPRAQTHTWLTPKWLLDELGEFDLDPCAAPLPRPFSTARRMISEAEGDGLSAEWSGRVWLNPPYGPFAKSWLEKLERHGDGIALIFARTETQWLQPILDRNGVFLLAGRITFLMPDGLEAKHSAGAPSLLIPFGRKNVGKILASNLQGVWKQ